MRCISYYVIIMCCINQPAPRLAMLEKRAPAAGRNRSNADPSSARRLARIQAHLQMVSGQDWRVAHDLAFPRNSELSRPSRPDSGEIDDGQ
jgi:hypothetical protein